LWNATGAALAISVQPFVWQTAWFKAAAAASLAALLAWAVRRVERWRAGLRLERLHRKHALERERARISRDIHDDLGASLTQIVFLSEQADSRLPQPEPQWNQRIRTAARNTIRSLDEIVWAVSPKHDTLESLANYLTQFVLEHFGLAGVQCLLEIPTVLPAAELSAEVRHNLLLATREAVQNVVAHAKATQARVKLELTEAALEISVSDNGAGFPQVPSIAQGNGLLNMRRRLDQIGGETTITSNPGSGTTVRFRLLRSRFQTHSAAEFTAASNPL
ncbi:MAG TPA: ATP-binding protein, partial [Bacillota bacterium]|nr:ATP-binding protein [Bacillota bacterium]